MDGKIYWKEVKKREAKKGTKPPNMKGNGKMEKWKKRKENGKMDG